MRAIFHLKLYTNPYTMATFNPNSNVLKQFQG